MLFCCLQVLKELVNKSPMKDIIALYGNKLTCRIHLARIQLILAMCNTITDLPEPCAGIYLCNNEKRDLLFKYVLVNFSSLL